MGIYGTPGIQCEGLQPYKDKSLTDNSKTTNSVAELSCSPGKRMEQSVKGGDVELGL